MTCQPHLNRSPDSALHSFEVWADVLPKSLFLL